MRQPRMRRNSIGGRTVTTKSLKQWATPHETSALDEAFPARGDQLTPDYAALPQEFRDGNVWTEAASALLFGHSQSVVMHLKKGLDEVAVRGHIRCVLGTFSTKHEHKIAGAGYLLSRWFDLESECAL